MLWPCRSVVLVTVRDLADPETAFLGHLWQHFLFLFSDPFLWVLCLIGYSAVLSLNLRVRILTNLHGDLRTTVACQWRCSVGLAGPGEPGLVSP